MLYFVRKKGETIEGLTDGLGGLAKEEELVIQVLGLLNKVGQLEKGCSKQQATTYVSIVSLECRVV